MIRATSFTSGPCAPLSSMRGNRNATGRASKSASRARTSGAAHGLVRRRSIRLIIAGTSGMIESHTSSIPTKPMVPNWLKPRKRVMTSEP